MSSYGRKSRRSRGRTKDNEKVSLMPVFFALVISLLIGMRYAEGGPLYEARIRIEETFSGRDFSDAMEVLGKSFAGREDSAAVVFGRMILGLDDETSPKSEGEAYEPQPSMSTAGDINLLTFDIPESPMPEADDCAAFWNIVKEEEFDGTPNSEFKIPSPDKVDDNVYKPSFAFSKPLDKYRITSPFGYRIHPISGNTTFHYGVDLAASSGTKIHSAAGGTVMETGTGRINGNYVKVSHPEGFATHYCHLKNINVKKGQKVSKGQILGTVGSTGYSTGPHLHFEVRKNGKILNPFDYFGF